MKSATLLNQALQLQHQGELRKARALYERVLKVEPRNVQALHLLGVIAAQTDHHQWAVDLITRAIALVPGEAALHNDLGNALIELRRVEEAIASFGRAIALNPDYAEAYYNRGDALYQAGRLSDALESYDASIARKPDFPAAHNNRGNVLRDFGRTDDALASYERALTLDPSDAQLHLNRATELRKLRRLEDAVASYSRAIELQPTLVEAHNDLGTALRELGRPLEALASLDRALALAPKLADAHVNRANALLDLQRIEESILEFDRALALQPDHPEAINNRGNALKCSGRIEEALKSFDLALALRPDYADAYLNKGVALLASGRLQEGWPLYERRWSSEVGGPRARFAPDWKGGTHTKSLLVLPEQGVGDQIFYSSMLLDLQKFADEITVAVDARLLALYERSFGADGLRIVSMKDALPATESQVYMASLGQFLRNDFASIGQARSPYLKSCPQRRATLRESLLGSNRLLCGVSWKSKAPLSGGQKSLSLETLSPLLSVSDVTFVNLQYGDTREEQDRLSERAGLDLTDVSSVDNFNDLDGLAALIDACDVVVSVSNTTAHLAGALGKNLLLMLPQGSGLLWYWHYDRSDCPWYPTATLVRQAHAGAWDDVVAAVERTVRQL